MLLEMLSGIENEIKELTKSTLANVRYNYVIDYASTTYFFVPICMVLLRSFLTN